MTNLKHPVKESISLKRVMGQHLFKPSYGCHVRSSLKAASRCANITFSISHRLLRWRTCAELPRCLFLWASFLPIICRLACSSVQGLIRSIYCWHWRVSLKALIRGRQENRRYGLGAKDLSEASPDDFSRTCKRRLPLCYFLSRK